MAEVNSTAEFQFPLLPEAQTISRRVGARKAHDKRDALGDSDNSNGGLNMDLPAAGKCLVPSIPVGGTSQVCSGAATWTLMPPNTALNTEQLSSSR